MNILKTYRSILFIGIILFLFVSCIKEVDFDQTENIVLTPVIEADFIYSTFDIEKNIPKGLPPDTEFEITEALRDTVNYDFVGSDFAIDNIDRVALTIEIKNQIERAFLIQFQFLTESGEPIGRLYEIPVAAGNGENEEPVVSVSVPDPIVLDQAILQQLQNAKKMYTELFIPTLNTDLKGILELRSKAVYFINYSL